MAEMIPQSISANSEATSGEKKVFRILQDALLPDEDYLVWYEPKVINRYTDFLIYSQHFGLLVVEVKDWITSNISEFNPQTFKGTFYGLEKETLNPLAQARDVANKIKSMLSKIPSLLNQEGEHKNKLKFPIGYCVFLTNISRKQAEEKGLLANDQILGCNQTLFSDDLSFDTDEKEQCKCFVSKLKQAFPIKFYFDPISYKDLKALRFAIFPEVRVNVEKIRKLRSEKDEQLLKTLDLEQEQTAKSLGEGHRILKGVAGSGKTLVLACRVKYLKKLHPEWNILIVCYNISLRRYLEKLIDVSGNIEKPSDKESSSSNNKTRTIEIIPSLEIIHFHDLVKQMTNANLKKNDGETDEQYDTRVGQILLGRIAEGTVKKGKYDAILVDEGQDFATEWMQGLSQLLNENTDSLLFCYDPAQNVFGRKKPNWKTAGFKVQGKRPTELKRSYRNTVEILDIATRFGKIESKTKTETDDLLDITLFPEIATDRHGEFPILKYFDSYPIMIDFILNEIEILTKNSECNFADIGVLYTSRKIFPELFISSFIKKFDKDKIYWVTKDRDSKINLNISDQSIKLMTIESCKGLEFRVVFFVGMDELPKQDRKEESQRNLTYVGLTRAQDILYVLARSKEGYLVEFDSLLKSITRN